MPRELNAYFLDIVRAVNEIREFCQGLDFNAYFKNRMVRRAVERDFEIIGEALKRCEEVYPGSTSSLPQVSEFARFRDRLAHAYFKTDQEIVWEAISVDLPPLYEAISKLLKDEPVVNLEDPFSAD